MNRSRTRFWLPWFAFGAALAESTGATLPFTTDLHDGQWTRTTVQRAVAPGLTCETVLVRAIGDDELIIFNSTGADLSSEALPAFARRVIASLSSYRASEPIDQQAKEIGYDGRKLLFNLTSDKAAFECALFVFVDGVTGWGVLHAKPKGTPGRLSADFGPLRPGAALPAGAVGLTPYHVKSVPVSSFPFGVEAIRDDSGRHFRRIEITNVTDRSTAQQAGLRTGDHILALDGRKIEDFNVGVGKDSDLGRVLLNRDDGALLTLLIQPAASGKSFTVKLHASRHGLRPMNDLLRDSGLQ